MTTVTRQPVTLDDVVNLAAQLSPQDQVRLVELVMPMLEQVISPHEFGPSDSVYGMWADLGPAPSAEEIDEARREAWGVFASGDDY